MTGPQTTPSSATPAEPAQSYTLMHPAAPFDEAMSLVFNAIDDGAMWQVQVMCNGALHSAEYFVSETDALRWAAREATMIAAVHLHAEAERDDKSFGDEGAFNRKV